MKRRAWVLTVLLGSALGVALPAFGEPSMEEANAAMTKDIRKRIAGHENEPAEKVFKNLRLPMLKSEPAKGVLGIMLFGYSRALGVSCTYCHDEKDFSTDDKRPKNAAREMAELHSLINDKLGKMKNLKPRAEGPFINCNTCHRGHTDPAFGQQ
jgi:hypothetical protein